ncbi:MAG TPA: hypothetical protein VFS66_12760 [Acidimicrobiia bacterium]|nr:hypothetical protein [Acidimicrobiia bacterium]
MKPHDLGDLMQEYGRHLETQMTPLDLDQASVYQAKPRPRADTHRWMAVVSVAAVSVVILVVVALYLASSSLEDEVADTAPTPTTLAPDVESMTDREIIEAGVAAFYSGDGERAADLFELPDRTDDEIRQESVYQAAIGGRLTLNCIGPSTPGVFQCTTPYQNALTDAIGYVDSPGDSDRFVVEDGVITAFAFPEHSWIVVGMGSFLASEGRFEGYEGCSIGPFSEVCATIQMENLDTWVEWREDVEPIEIVEVALESWYGGDCETAHFLSDSSNGCSTSSKASQTIEYESILGAQVFVENCEETARTSSTSDFIYLSCEVHYSNAMNNAAGKPPSVTTREFGLWSPGWVLTGPGQPWYEVDYPEDIELRESFRRFAGGGELQDEYAAAGCALARTPVCANLILDNLTDWAAWYETNS